jgi:hypothetical protein
MIRKYRIMMYIGIGLIFPTIAYLAYPDWSVFWFTLLVAVLGTVIEIVYHKQGTL